MAIGYFAFSAGALLAGGSKTPALLPFAGPAIVGAILLAGHLLKVAGRPSGGRWGARGPRLLAASAAAFLGYVVLFA